jgi:hypothetical protein
MNKHQKGFAPIIIALIILVLSGVGGTGYYLISKQVKLSNNQNQQNSEANYINTSNWKTYTNGDVGFEIKYPSNWESPFKNWGPGFTAGIYVNNDNLCVVDAMGWLGSNDAEIADLIGKGYVKTSIKIDGIDGIRLTRNPAGAGLTEAVYFEANGKNFRIGRNRGVGDKIEQDCIKNYNQILSTFKFTNEKTNKDETADWKIYKYEKYGFEIKYPQTWTPNISTTYELGSLGFTSPKKDDGSFINFWINRYNLSEGGFGYPPETLSAPNTTIDGIKAYKDEGYVRNLDGPSTQSISFEKNGYIYILTFQVFKKYNLQGFKNEDIKPAIFNSEEQIIWDEVISTFKFL